MSMTNSIVACGFLPTRIQTNPSLICNSQTRLSFTPSPFITTASLVWDSAGRAHQVNGAASKRRFLVCNVVESGASHSESAFSFFQWVGMMAAMILPFFTHKWASLLKIKNEVDTAVQIAEDIVEAVEKVADEVEHAAEHLAEDLPEGGPLRRAVDFVETVAERVSNDAHTVDSFIDKVQEVEERVEEYFESWGPGPSNDGQSKEEEDRARESHPINMEK